MAHGGKREAGPGKKIGRPAKPAIALATKAVASEALALDGKPDHLRKCDCKTCKKQSQMCKCVTICGDCQKLEENCECEKTRETKLECRVCHTVEDHKICHCEICAWWDLMLARDQRVQLDTRKYLTDRRDGKPAQGVFVGDTRESARELDFGDLPELIAPGQSSAARRPN